MSAAARVRTARNTIVAAWECGRGPVGDPATEAAQALEDRGLLQSPGTAAELEHLRARVAELEDAAPSRVIPVVDDVPIPAVLTAAAEEQAPHPAPCRVPASPDCVCGPSSAPPLTGAGVPVAAENASARGACAGLRRLLHPLDPGVRS